MVDMTICIYRLDNLNVYCLKEVLFLSPTHYTVKLGKQLKCEQPRNNVANLTTFQLPFYLPKATSVKSSGFSLCSCRLFLVFLETDVNACFVPQRFSFQRALTKPFAPAKSSNCFTKQAITLSLKHNYIHENLYILSRL